MQAYEGYFENGKFYTAGQTISIPEQRRIFITILEEPPVKFPSKDVQMKFFDDFEALAKEVKEEDQELRASWIERLNAAVILSSDEKIFDVPRSTLMREPIDFNDEEY
jgi:hypothetical protein